MAAAKVVRTISALAPGGAGWRKLIKAVYRALGKDDIFTYASALAFRAMLALFPFLLFLMALITFLDIPGAFERLLAWSRAVLPPTAMQEISAVVQQFQQRHDAGLMSFGVLAAIWAASGGVRSAMTVLNRAYDIQEQRQTWRRYLVSVGYTIAIGVIVVIVSTLMFVGPRTLEWISTQLELNSILIVLWSWLRYPVLLVLLVVLTAVAYSFLPNGVPFRWISPGSVAAILIWLLASLGFRFYISSFGRYNVAYGSVGAIMVLLLYLYLSSLALLIGGELNAVVAREAVKMQNDGSEV